MAHDLTYHRQIEQLRRIVLRRWWVVTGLLWLTVGSFSLWSLRHEFPRIQQYFTWAAVRYALAYNRGPALGLGLCVGLTVALLVAESRYILFGLSKGEKRRLHEWLQRIQRKGSSHPLWHRIHAENADKL